MRFPCPGRTKPGGFAAGPAGKSGDMGISASILLIAIGAILRFGVKLRDELAGAMVNWAIVGDVVMTVGAISLAFSIAVLVAGSRRAPAAGDGYRTSHRPYAP